MDTKGGKNGSVEYKIDENEKELEYDTQKVSKDQEKYKEEEDKLAKVYERVEQEKEIALAKAATIGAEHSLAQNAATIAHLCLTQILRELFAWIALHIASTWILGLTFIVLCQGIMLISEKMIASALCYWSVSAIASSFTYYMQMKEKKAFSPLDGAPYIKNKHEAIILSIISGIFFGFAAAFCIWLCYKTPNQVWRFSINDEVLSTLCRYTTISVLGILGAVMFWLFPRGGSKNHPH